MNFPVREKAIDCLVTIGDPKVIKPLLGYLNDVAPDVRKKAAKALGEIGDASALETLEQVLKDKKWGVRQAAKKQLRLSKHGIEAICLTVNRLRLNNPP